MLQLKKIFMFDTAAALKFFVFSCTLTYLRMTDSEDAVCVMLQ